MGALTAAEAAKMPGKGNAAKANPKTGKALPPAFLKNMDKAKAKAAKKK